MKNKASSIPHPAFANPHSVHHWPLWRTGWRRLKRRPLQYLLFVIGVALGVAMMVSIDIANGSASRAFTLSTNAITGKATHRLLGGPDGLDETIYQQLLGAPTQVNSQLSIFNYQFSAAPVVEDYVLAADLGNQPMRLVGVDPFAEPPFRDYLAGDGSSGLDGLTAFIARPNSVIIAANTAAEYGVALGEEIRLDVDGRSMPVQIVGLIDQSDGDGRRALSGIIFSDIATAQELLGMTGRLSRIDLIADDAQITALRDTLPDDLFLETAAARSNTIQQMTAAFELNLQALSLLALVVGMFLIYNTVTFSVVQRRPLFGILRSLGVTRDQLFIMILAEASALSLLGALLGLGLGVILGRGMVGLVTQTINDFYFVVSVQSIDVPLSTLVKGLVIGVAAALAASLIPAWEAMRTTPLTTMRRSNLESKTARLLPWLLVGWLVLGSIGAFLLWLPDVSLIITFAGLFAVLIAFSLLSPPVTAVFMRLLTPVGDKLFGALGRMAPRDIVRSLSRTSVAIAALMVAVSVIIGVSIMIGSFRGTVTQWLSETLQADIYLSPPALTGSQSFGALPPDAVTTAITFPGIDEVVSARHLEVTLPDYEMLIELVAVSGDVSRGNRGYAWIDGDEADLWERFNAGEGIFVSEPFILKEDISYPPPPLTITTPQGAQTFPVLAVIYDYSSDRGTVMMGRPLYNRIWDDDGVSTLGLFVERGTDVDPLVDQIRAALNGRTDVVVQSNQSIRAEALEIFDRTFAITAALRLLAIVVAFIGVLSALMSLQLERARELGVLRAAGMTRRQMWALTLMETGLMGGVAGLLAMPTGYVLAWILIYVINIRSFGWTLQMNLQPSYFLQALAVALIAALLAGIYPSIRLSKMVIAMAIRQE